MRRGEELVAMTSDMLKRIFDEGVPDFSAEICPEAKFEDLDPTAINAFREVWIRKAGNNHLKHASAKQLLRDINKLLPNIRLLTVSVVPSEACVINQKITGS